MTGRFAASPARAGMYPRGRAASRNRKGFPRTRGDVPRKDLSMNATKKLPPHARGCTVCGPTAMATKSASPARAGMYLERRAGARSGASFPRTRGDVPASLRAVFAGAWLPPHARGCTDDGLPGRDAPRASPARAGMYRAREGAPCQPGRFPRTRGDVPYDELAGRSRPRLPPHARGCTRPRDVQRRVRRAPPPPRARGRTRYNPPFPFPVGANGRPVAVRRHLPHPSAVASVRGLRAESGRDRRMARLVRRAAARRPRAPRPPKPLRAAGLADAASLRPPARSGSRAGAGQA